MFLIVLYSCTKKQTSYVNTAAKPNTLTVLYNGVTYEESGAPTLSSVSDSVQAYCNVVKSNGYSTLSLYMSRKGTPHLCPVSVNVISANGPGSGVGLFNCRTSLNIDFGYIVDEYLDSTYASVADTGTFKVDSASINITGNTNNTVVGTYWIHGYNAYTTKIITGTINYARAKF